MLGFLVIKAIFTLKQGCFAISLVILFLFPILQLLDWIVRVAQLLEYVRHPAWLFRCEVVFLRHNRLPNIVNIGRISAPSFLNLQLILLRQVLTFVAK